MDEIKKKINELDEEIDAMLATIKKSQTELKKEMILSKRTCVSLFSCSEISIKKGDYG
jgi:hypothetical protein